MIPRNFPINIFKEKLKKKTHLKCPITGDFLIFIGNNEGKENYKYYYYPENDNSIIYYRNNYIWDLFVSETKNSKKKRYFKLIDESNWIEMIKYEGLRDLVSVNESKENIESLLKRAKDLKNRRIKKTQEDLEKGIIIPIIINIDLDEVPYEIASNAPFESSYNFIRRKQFESIKNNVDYPYFITEKNIDELIYKWNVSNNSLFKQYGELQIGDMVDRWQGSGWEKLSLMEGEIIIRNGVIIYRRINNLKNT
jgi:hypothetical protein